MADDIVNPSEVPNASIVADAAKVAEAVKAAETAAEAATKKASDDAAALRAAAGNNGDSEMVEKIVKERLDKELATIKESLNKAYAARDENAAKVAEFEKKEREATVKRLAEEGKHKEAYELQLAEKDAALAALAKRNIELSRDVAVREAVRSFAFRNGKAEAMAVQEITSNLVQNEHKEWVHRSGVSIKEYCEAFAKDEDQSFLFKAKANSGNGVPSTISGNGVPSTDNKPKSLFAIPQAEVIKMAAEGKLKARH
jgi:hypothetical protein